MDRALHRQTVENVEKYRSEVLVEAYILQEAAWKAACAGKSGAIYQALRALDMRIKVLGLARKGIDVSVEPIVPPATSAPRKP